MEDRRAEGPSRAGLGQGGVSLLLWLFSRFGLPGLLIGGAVLYFGGQLLSGAPATNDSSERNAVPADGRDPDAELVQFVSFVLDDAQDTWGKRFAAMGQRYEPARLVLFRDQTRSGCGLGAAAMGPFYCPRDQRVYIDLSFYRELRQRLGAPGDFAQAYVIAHELGHHVQHLLGLDRKAAEHETGAGGQSVRLELQADCLAGIWAHATDERQLLEHGDLDEALKAAAAVGDDRLQRAATGTVAPESWTHGSSAQRARWFDRGYQTGKLEACDTFAAREL